MHHALKACRTCAKANGWQRPSKPNQVLEMFFTPQAPLNPSRVSALAPVHAPDANEQATEPTYPIVNPYLVQPTTTKLPCLNRNMMICERGLHLLRDLEAAINQIPSDVPSTTLEGCLSIFVIDPHACVTKAEEAEEGDWPILNLMLKSSFGWGETEMTATIPWMLKCRDYSLDGCHCPSLALEVTGSCVTTWVRVGVNRAQVLCTILAASASFHTFPLSSGQYSTKFQ